MSFKEDGFAIVPNVASVRQIAVLTSEMEVLADDVATRGETAFGIRNVLQRSRLIREFACSKPMTDLVAPVLGPTFQAVRGIFFDKTKQANWPLPWHQDRVIAVQRRAEVPGFRNWTVKHGRPHVEPPVELLKRMVTLRLHLDPSDANNGALQVMPGRQQALLDAQTLASFRQSGASVTCRVQAGDVVMMRPLTPHSSRKSKVPSRRRVLHLEYCAANLPAPLVWAETA